MFLRPAALVFALAASALAWGEDRDGAERLAWLAYVEGEIEFQGAGARPTASLPDRPLARGDRLATRRDSRAELSLGTAALRIEADTEVSIADLRAKSIRLELTGRSVSVHLHELLTDERFELVTPTATIVLNWVGEYRVDVVTEGATALSVRSGVATVATAGGPVEVLGGQRVVIEGRGARATLVASPPRDDFDDWVLEREVQLAATEPPRDGAGSDYERYGEWVEDPQYGRVWAPDVTYSSWRSSGVWISSGRWVYLDHFGRWCWVPPSPRPTPTPLPQYARETHPYGGSRLGGAPQSWPPRSFASWGSSTSTIRSSSGSASSPRASRPFGSSGNRRSSSRSSPLSPGSVLTPP